MLEEALKSCRWEKLAPGLWEKSRSRIFIDIIGIYLYRFLGVNWVRTHGLDHSRILSLQERHLIFKDKSKLNLLTGEWQ